MKKILTLFAVILISVAAMAQPAAMKFAGPAKFGVEAMDAWQDNESDTIVFKMNDATNGDITLPAFTYNAMKLTIPSFTIHGLKFDFDATTRNATFPEQEYKETIIVDGVEKAITGYSFSGSYNAKDNTFTLTTKLFNIIRRQHKYPSLTACTPYRKRQRSNRHKQRRTRNNTRLQSCRHLSI